MENREFEVIVWGASGFTGELVGEYLCKQYKDGQVKWALAGRNQKKLEEVKARLGPGAEHAPIIVANSDDLPSLDAMAKRTKVVLSTVGPYAVYGKLLIEACVKNGTHYCDLTGEPFFMSWSIQNWHEEAKKTGAMIVHACGYDSIPSDLGTFMLADHMAKKHQRKLAYVTCAAVAKDVKGGISGGTVASMKYAIAHPDEASMDPYSLTPPGYPRGKDSDITLPTYDSDLKSFTAPFIMATTNAKVVRRSNGLLGMSYGEAFSYREVMDTGSGVKGYFLSIALTIFLAFFAISMKVLPNCILDMVLPQPGEGPTREQREKGYFKTILYGRSEDGTTAVEGVITGKVDPGYLGTSMMLCESALCLAKDADLPGVQGGVLTPASAMGAALIDRLKAVGFTYDVTDA